MHIPYSNCVRVWSQPYETGDQSSSVKKNIPEGSSAVTAKAGCKKLHWSAEKITTPIFIFSLTLKKLEMTFPDYAAGKHIYHPLKSLMKLFLNSDMKFWV